MAAAILRLLTEHLPPDRARQVQQQIVADVRRASEAAGVAPPTWVREAEDDGEGSRGPIRRSEEERISTLNVALPPASPHGQPAVAHSDLLQ
jgi:hypothetical protein